uniref:RING-type domain-containing protein n=1 Tax=Clastoptera arizonana TaxID=38151 RepID=A0A1B6CTE8_9HEMI
MDKMSHFELYTALKFVVKTLECPVCLDTLAPPLVMCSNNHCVCSSCGKDLKECPTCRSEMTSNVRYPLALDNILKGIPIKCRNSIDCEKFLLPSEQKEHIKICPYQLTFCKIPSCCWKGEKKTLIQHVKTSHQNNILLVNGQTTVTFINFSVDKPYYSVKIISYVGSLFWMSTKNDPKKGEYKVVFTNMAFDEQEYEAQIEFVTKDIRYLKKEKVLSEDVDIEDKFSKGTLYLPSVELSPFIDDKKQLKYEINIFKVASTIKLNSNTGTELPNKNEDGLLNILKRIDNKELCDFCEDTFLPPIKVCANYHFFCDNCKVTKCLRCKDSAKVSSFKIQYKCTLSYKCEVYRDDKGTLAQHEKI